MKTYQWGLATTYISLRWYIIIKFPKLTKPYLAWKLKKRQGKCNNCGVCCWNFRAKRYCKHYNEKEKRCNIYPNWNPVCRYGPIDKLEKNMHQEKLCGFTFK